MARMSTGLEKTLRDSQPPNVFHLPGDIKSGPSSPVHSSFLLYQGSKLLVRARGPGQDPPAGGIQVLMNPEEGEAILSDHGPQCLERTVLTPT